MECNFSINRQSKKGITAGAVISKKKMLEADMYKNTEKIDEITPELNRIQKAIRRRIQNHRTHRQLFLRPNELKILKTEIRTEIDALKNNFAHRRGKGTR